MKEKECTCPIFRALKKKGLRWNPETGVIEVNRLWRARLGEIYFFINSNGELYPEKELNNKIDNIRWKIRNGAWSLPLPNAHARSPIRGLGLCRR